MKMMSLRKLFKITLQMTYKGDKDLEEDERYLSISKNRLTGKLTRDKGVELYYDEVSKRISDTRDFSIDYGWNKDSDGFVDIPEAGQLPFDF